jgi:hypothetical protein
MEETSSGVKVKVEGSKNEKISIAFMNPRQQVVTVTCTVHNDQTVITIDSNHHCH